ncbi:WGR domain-containing protein [Asticcacaulis taihuensis]|uniref:WGR domain-containing protein n=1 Tax=Asticcacaulis taihuensis TaxID=260084 RepID=UPI0034E94FE7
MSVCIIHIDPEKNTACFCAVDVQRPLLGKFTGGRHWTRNGTTGQSKTFWFGDDATADQMAKPVSVINTRRGYVETNSAAGDNP